MTDRSAATGGSTSQGAGGGSNITPSASDPVEAAQAALTAAGIAYANRTSATPEEARVLRADLRDAAAHVDELEGRR